MAAAAHSTPYFQGMNEARLRQWVEANPGRVNDRDKEGYTPLCAAVRFQNSLPLTVWLLDEKGAVVNATGKYGCTPPHDARSLDILTALMDRGANPNLPTHNGMIPLMFQAAIEHVGHVACLLQDPRVRATIKMQESSGSTSLHWACLRGNESATTSILNLLLQARGDPALTTNGTDNDGQAPLAILRHLHPTHYAAIALLEQYPEAQQDAEKASLLVKARRLIVAANSNTVAPSCLQGRVARGQPLSRLAPMPVTGGQNEDEDEDEDEEESRKLRTLVAFLLGMEGGWKNAGMPRDVFRMVLDLLMPTWDPLRRKNAGAAPPLQEG